jgi:hypothetical protein
MVSPLTLLRNAEGGAKLKAAPDRSKGAARGIIKGGAPKPRPGG